MQETNILTKEQVIQLVNDLIDSKLDAFHHDVVSDFKRWDSLDSVTDQYSPITGASTQIGFFGTSKVSKPTVTGSKGANAALTSLMTALSNMGLVTDSTS